VESQSSHVSTNTQTEICLQTHKFALLYITGCLTFLCASLIKYRALLCVREVLELIMAKGPVTDYSSTLVHWMRNRQPRYKGGYQGEMERPSPSYIVDVGLSPPTLQSPQPNFT
jgi:hypothetical protein